MEIDFNGKTAVVTGGANGIGLATARLLAGGGANLWIFDLEREHPVEIAAGLHSRGIAVDVTDRASLNRAFDQTGPPDILVANAGMGGGHEFTEIPGDVWERTIAVNLTGVFHTATGRGGGAHETPAPGRHRHHRVHQLL